MKQHRIALIGLSGSGKSTVGPLLAEALGWRYLDTDRLVEAETHQTVANIFAQHGEAVFRDHEARALAHALDESQVVIGTGGGSIETPANLTHLQTRAFTIWLHAPTPTLTARLNTVSDRPLLAADPVAALEQMALRRAPLYAACADWIVATNGLTPREVVDEILRAFQRQPHESSPIQVTTPGGTYAVRAGPHLLAELPPTLDALGLRGRVWLVSDTSTLR